MESLTQLKSDYTAYLLENGQRPSSVLAFMESLEKTEAEFYEMIGSFEGLEEAIFMDYFQESLDRLNASPEFQQYDSGQKYAALYFTWFETLQKERSIVVLIDQQAQAWFWPAYLEGIKTPFTNFVKQVVQDGVDEDEIADRWFVNNVYPNILWEQAKGILDFWLKDRSKNFEKTDAVIEKQVRFVIDLIQPNFLDSGWDLLRYMFQRK